MAIKMAVISADQSPNDFHLRGAIQEKEFVIRVRTLCYLRNKQMPGIPS